MYRIILAGLCLLLSTNGYAGSIQDRNTGVSFPDEISISENGTTYTLQATGVSTRKKFFAKVYSIAHYLQDPQNASGNQAYDKVYDNEKAKQLTMIWVRSVDRNKIQDGFKDAFQKVMSRQEHARLQKEINQFIGFFNQNARDGDEYVIRWMPKGKIEVFLNGNKKGEIDNEAFASAVWDVWLGPKSAVNRSEMVSKM